MKALQLIVMEIFFAYLITAITPVKSTDVKMVVIVEKKGSIGKINNLRKRGLLEQKWLSVKLLPLHSDGNIESTIQQEIPAAENYFYTATGTPVVHCATSGRGKLLHSYAAWTVNVPSSASAAQRVIPTAIEEVMATLLLAPLNGPERDQIAWMTRGSDSDFIMMTFGNGHKAPVFHLAIKHQSSGGEGFVLEPGPETGLTTFHPFTSIPWKSTGKPVTVSSMPVGDGPYSSKTSIGSSEDTSALPSSKSNPPEKPANTPLSYQLTKLQIGTRSQTTDASDQHDTKGGSPLPQPSHLHGPPQSVANYQRDSYHSTSSRPTLNRQRRFSEQSQHPVNSYNIPYTCSMGNTINQIGMPDYQGQPSETLRPLTSTILKPSIYYGPLHPIDVRFTSIKTALNILDEPSLHRTVRPHKANPGHKRDENPIAKSAEDGFNTVPSSYPPHYQDRRAPDQIAHRNTQPWPHKTPYSAVPNEISKEYDYHSSRGLRRIGVRELPELKHWVNIASLGKGAYGKVDLHCSIENGQKHILAIKKVERDTEGFYLQRRETAILHKLRHNSIIRIEGFANVDSEFWMAMEFIPGKELYNYLANEPDLIDARLSHEILHQVLLAVEYMHASNIVHRDLKASNVMVVIRPPDQHDQPAELLDVKVIDMGFAAIQKAKHTLVRFLGSPTYAAPELYRGKPGYDGRAVDIYAYGTLVYICLTKQEVYPVDLSLDTLGERIRSFSISMLSDKGRIDHVYPVEARNLIQSCCSTLPKNRLSARRLLEHRWWSPTQRALQPKSVALPPTASPL